MMRIESVGPTSQPVRRPIEPLEPLNQAPPAQQAKTASAVVAIDGRTLLRQRLFDCAPDIEPPVARYDWKIFSSLPTPQYLTMEDRKLVSEIYEFAQAEEIDLMYVDVYAMQLADYRSSDDGKIMRPHNRGMAYDVEGHRVSYSFTEVDTASAQRIRNDPSLDTTRLDKAFVLFETDKDYSSLFHSDFDFLEVLVNRFSSTTDKIPVNDRFSQYVSLKRNFIEHKSTRVYTLDEIIGKKPEAKAVSKKPPEMPGKAAPATDLSSTFRQIMRQYLQKSGLPTLFETLMRMGR